MATPSPVTVRRATESDLDAILVLILTSFRQFPLFSFLYSPLDKDLSAAKDTIFFWRRRLLLELLDPGSSLIVAEIRDAKPGLERGGTEQVTDVERESWRMLDWIATHSGLSQESRSTAGCIVVGFAIWNVRIGHAASADEREKLAGHAVDFRTSWRAKSINLENYLWSKFYRRKDQDQDRYKVYLAAEEELELLFYAKSCYYLDNLCVDFRYQRMGIGGELLEWGMDKSKVLGLPVQTEAGPMGVGLYRKMGFKQVGVWGVKMVGLKEGGSEENDKKMILPVMRLGEVEVL